jgi:hypothetical protein
MGDLLRPKPDQWKRTQPAEDVPEDKVLQLATALMSVLQADVNPTQVQLAALSLVVQGVARNYAHCAGSAALNEARRQAAQLASLYEVNIIEEA